MYDAKFEPHIILTQLRVRGGTFLLHAQIRLFCSRTMNLPNKTYWTSFCQFDTISGMARLFPVSPPHRVNLCHWRLKVVSRVPTVERYAHRFYRFCLLFLRLRFIPGEVRTQSRLVNSPRFCHWAMEAVEDGPKLRIFIVSIWPNLRKYLERREFNANQGRGSFQVRNFSRPNPTSVEIRPSACRIVNVNSISTQLNFSHLYYIWVRAIEGALFTSFILVG